MNMILDFLRSFFKEAERGPEPHPGLIPPEPIFDSQGWCTDPRVIRVASRPGWFYKKLDTKDGLPRGITWHFTSTAAGTIMNMARRRRDTDRKEFKDPPGSWHFSVGQNGDIIQQISIRSGAFHAGSPTAKKTAVGWANHTTVSIELEGFGDKFSEAQIESACWLTKHLVEHCQIQIENAMFEHSKIDPTRKTDPGPVFLRDCKPRILAFAFAR